MASRKELEAALRAADKAGNVEDAKRLAAAIRNFNDTPQIDQTRAAFDALPTWQKPLQAADDVIRMIANGATLGWADNLAGNMPGGGGTEAEKNRTLEARQRGGSASTAAEILGMILPASRASQGAGAVTGMTGRGIGESMVREGLAGAAMGGTQALSDSSDLSDVAGGAVSGGIGGSIGGALGSMGGSLLDWAGRKMGFAPGAVVDDVIPPRTPEQMKQAVDGAYSRVDSLGTRYDPTDFQSTVQSMDDALKSARVNPRIHPNATAMMDDIRNMPNSGPISPRDLDDLRQIINRDVSGSRGEGHMAGIMSRHIDDFLEKGATTTGSTSASSAEASQALRTARDLNRRMRTLEDIDLALFKGSNSPSSRGDVNALRTMLNNPRRTRGMSKPEQEALKRVVRGSGVENLLQSVAGNSPITPIGTGIITTAATGNPVLGVLAGGGAALSKPALEGMARKYTDANIQTLLNAVAGGHTIPSAARSILPAAGQAAAVSVTGQDQERTRRRRRKRKN